MINICLIPIHNSEKTIQNLFLSVPSEAVETKTIIFGYNMCLKFFDGHISWLVLGFKDSFVMINECLIPLSERRSYKKFCCPKVSPERL